METHFQKAVRRCPNGGLRRTGDSAEHIIAAGFKYDRHSPRRCVDIHIFRQSQACVASAVRSTPTQYDFGASQCSVCEERLQDSGQRVEDFSVGVHLSLAFNIIATASVWSRFGTGDPSQRQQQPLPTQQSSLQTPALGKSPKHTHRQVTACESCVRFWVSKVPCSSTQSIKRQHSHCNPPEQRSCSESPSCALVSHRSPGSPPGPGSVAVPSVPMYLSAVGATCT